MRQVLTEKLSDSLARQPPSLTRRDVELPGVPGKALVVIGMRRSGKTSFLWQCLADRLAAGAPRESLVFLNFEDERLVGLDAQDVGWLIEQHGRQYPELAGTRCTWFLDEIQLVEGWESLARRLLDGGKLDLFLSGSSAKLLSSEVATSMRGRALEVLMQPFGFREWLRHGGQEPKRPWGRLPRAERDSAENRLGHYLVEGGFPETAGASLRDRHALLQSYVDVVVLRDVIERHAVSNPVALRWIQRHLLANPAGAFSAQKQFDALKSQGVAVAKDTVHAYLAHLEDAFLVHTLSLHTASERQRMVNPRKAYPADPGLIPLFERTGRPQTGHALETVALHELRRRGAEVAYLKTRQGWEVDFHADFPDAAPLLVQVCATLDDEPTFEREVRSLRSALEEHAGARAHLVTLDGSAPKQELPEGVEWWPAARWLLEAWGE
jgi:predicted AAA+ superfamily ATPase